MSDFDSLISGNIEAAEAGAETPQETPTDEVVEETPKEDEKPSGETSEDVKEDKEEPSTDTEDKEEPESTADNKKKASDETAEKKTWTLKVKDKTYEVDEEEMQKWAQIGRNANNTQQKVREHERSVIEREQILAEKERAFEEKLKGKEDVDYGSMSPQEKQEYLVDQLAKLVEEENLSEEELEKRAALEFKKDHERKEQLRLAQEQEQRELQEQQRIQNEFAQEAFEAIEAIQGERFQDVLKDFKENGTPIEDSSVIHLLETAAKIKAQEHTLGRKITMSEAVDEANYLFNDLVQDKVSKMNADTLLSLLSEEQQEEIREAFVRRFKKPNQVEEKTQEPITSKNKRNKEHVDYDAFWNQFNTN